MNESHEKERSIFFAASEIESSAEREAYLADACGDDVELRRNIDLLLELQDDDRDLLGKSAVVGTTSFPTLQSQEKVGTAIGPYKLREQLGEGGMGIVYVAEQSQPFHRKVALKVIKPGMDTKEVIARFEAERQAMALMEHPNIAKVFDAGITEQGRPYFAMELVKGIAITEYCDKHRLSVDERLKLFMTVCQAVQHAHQKGILHRDLKPSNVLVEQHDVIPVPKIIDFGVAKATNRRLTERTLYTKHAQFVGTPMYMSPEQAELNGLDVDTRSDIYSMGVLLYEILTGDAPFQRQRLKEACFDELRRIIREEEPAKPSTCISTLKGEAQSTVSLHRSSDWKKLQQSLRGELDWIVMKTLEKDRNRRYQSASALAEDIQRYLHSEPVEAGPPSSLYRFRKFAWRNKALVTTVAAVMLMLLVTTGVTLWQSIRVADAHRDTLDALKDSRQSRAETVQHANEAQNQRDMAEGNLYLAEMRLGYQDWQAGQVGRLQKSLTNHIPSAGEPDKRGWEWHYLNSLCHQDLNTLKGHSGSVYSVAYSPDGRFLASGGRGGEIFLWSAQTGELISKKQTGHTHIYQLAWSSDGQKLATAGEGLFIETWDFRTLEKIRSYPVGESAAEHVNKEDIADRLHTVVWSPDGAQIATANNGKLIVWNTMNDALSIDISNPSYISELSWSPDGKWLSGCGISRSVAVWDTKTGEEVALLDVGPVVDVFTVAWSPNGKRLAAGDYQMKSVVLFEAESWKELARLKHSGGVGSVKWHPNNRWIAVGTRGQRVHVWDTETSNEVVIFQGHTGWINSVDWSPDGRRLASASRDGTIKLWEMPQIEEQNIDLGSHVQWNPVGDRFALHRGKVIHMHSRGGKTKPQVIPGIAGVWNYDGSRFAVFQADKNLAIWNTQDWQVVQLLPVNGSPSIHSQGHGICWSSDNDHLAIPYRSRMNIWSLSQKQIIHSYEIHRGNFHDEQWSPDGQQLAISGLGGSLGRAILIANVASNEEPVELKLPEVNHWTSHVSWSPDGKKIVSGGWSQVLHIWDVTTGTCLNSLTGHSGAIWTVDWSPDGKRIVSGSWDATIKLWDADSGREILSIPSTVGIVSELSWSPDGQILFVRGEQGTRFWETSVSSDFKRNLKQQYELLLLAEKETELEQAPLEKEDKTTKSESKP